MQQSVTVLPDEYVESYRIDMMHDKKKAIWLNLVALLVVLPFIGIYLLLLKFTPIYLTTTFDLQTSVTLQVVALSFILAMILYIILHELVHGIVFKFYSHEKLKFGFHGLYASACIPNAYFYKKPYLHAGLAPLVVFSFVFIIPLFFVNDLWFLFFYGLLTVHISGCSGDIYVAFKLMSYASDTLINDQGVSMTFYQHHHA